MASPTPPNVVRADRILGAARRFRSGFFLGSIVSDGAHRLPGDPNTWQRDATRDAHGWSAERTAFSSPFVIKRLQPGGSNQLAPGAPSEALSPPPTRPTLTPVARGR